ncbi:tyrosine--tRNA ligase [Longirhabdus pacifica]|uniref:tyrosine--tRNA ligase n=1 Tax=Longirhabdus pacifica TaxID=2305227 RepID=UPI00197D97C5|nr:tyrosine--tRNA ligase [Longirhabdus pacifica]
MTVTWEQLTQEQQSEVNKQWEIAKRGVAEIVPESELKQKIMTSLATGTPMKIKLGLDPSAPDIHIGHTVVLHKLRQFQELGHRIQIVIGDFTGRIGDPTGKSETRKQLSVEEIEHNASTYKEQIFKILDEEKTEVRYNAEWLSPLTFEDVVKLAANVTVARMLERDDFTKRFQSEQAISVHEFFYPLMQGYDSVALESDLELGGTDQKFNLLMGRTLQKDYGQKQQATMMMPIIEGLDGVQKMSKSLNNYIGVSEAPNEIYGKSMSIPDELMVKYYELATDMTNEELSELKKGLEDGSIHPRDAKMKLARTFVRMYHDEQAAEEAEHHFKTVFQQNALPEDIDTIKLSSSFLAGEIRIVDLLMELKLQASNSEAKRSVKQGAVRMNGEKMVDMQQVLTLNDGDIVQVGKRKFAKISL